MSSGKTRTRGLLIAGLCCAVWACGSDDDGEPAGEAVDAGGSAADGGATGGGNDAGSPGGGGGGVVGGGQDSGQPPDLGMNSEGDTFFRADTLVLKAPGLFAKPLGLEYPLNDLPQQEVDKSLTLDANGDGFVDLSLLIRFIKTADPAAKNGQVTPGGGQCPFPVAADSACGPDTTFPFQSPPLGYTNGKDCKLDGTDIVASGKCFVTAKGNLTMSMAALGAVPLQNAQVVGSWQADGIVNGHVRGFLPKAVAQSTKIAEPVPQYLLDLSIRAGTPLTDFLSTTQIDTQLDGWWFLFDYTAKPASFDPDVKLPTP